MYTVYSKCGLTYVVYRNKNTIDMETLAGINFCGFNALIVFAEILLHFLSQKCLLLKRGAYIHRKTYAVLLKTTKV